MVTRTQPTSPDATAAPDNAGGIMNDRSGNKLGRRDFMKMGTAGLSAAMMAASLGTDVRAGNNSEPMIGFRAPTIDLVRIDFVGVGENGIARVGVKNPW